MQKLAVSELDAEAYDRSGMQGLTDDGSVTIVGIAAGGSWYSQLDPKEEDGGSSREMHIDL